MAFTETDATNYLMHVGIPASILGFKYVRTAIMLAGEDENIVHEITSRLYPEVARRHSTTGARAERAIRHAVEVAWERGDYDFQLQVFGYSVSPNRGKPTNSEFIGRSADYLQSQTITTDTFTSAPVSLRAEFMELWSLFCERKEARV